MSRSGFYVCFQNQLLPPFCRASLWRSSACHLHCELERTLKSGKQFAKQREILLGSLVDQVMQLFGSIAHIKQVASGNLDAYIVVRFCVVRLMLAPGVRADADLLFPEIDSRYPNRWSFELQMFARPCTSSKGARQKASWKSPAPRRRHVATASFLGRAGE